MQNLHVHSTSTATANWNRRGLRIVFSLAVGIAVAVSSIASAQTLPPPQKGWTITDLGVVSTISGRASGDTDSSATAINASGTVVGFSGVYITDAEQEGFVGFLNQDGFIWTPDSKNGTTGKMTYIGGLPGDYCFSPEYKDPYVGVTKPSGYTQLDSVPYDINSSGQAVGYSWWSPDGTCAKIDYHGALYQNGNVVDLGVPPQLVGPSTPYSESLAGSINDAGQIVGDASARYGGLVNAWIYGGSYSILGNPPYPPIFPSGFVTSEPSKINSSGTIVGTAYVSDLSFSLGFKHTGTGPLLASDVIGDLGGGQGSAANGLNDSGMVVGEASVNKNGNLSFHALLIDKQGGAHDLGTLSKDPLSSSSAFAINNTSFNIVGISGVDPAQSWLSTRHAVLWQNSGGPIDLNQMLDPSVAPPIGTADLCNHCWELISATGINDLGQIVGEGFINGEHHAFLLTPPCIAAGGDTDGDGLCDDWEKNGYTDPKTGQFIDLPHMGADPNYKDIFVQVDYMVGPGGCDPSGNCTFGHTHKPNPDAMAAVVAAFANAPVENPDGLTGIALHIDCGSDCIMNPLTGDTWGDLSKAKAIFPEVNPLGAWQDNNCLISPGGIDSCIYDWTAFNAFETSNFLPTGRAASFHYMIFAHDLGMQDIFANLLHISGASQKTPDSSFVVALGHYAGAVGSIRQQGGTFMHELGHNLGLHHGGLDNINFKPNYLSIMSYLYQMQGLLNNNVYGYLDYSRFPAIPDLNEFALNETLGLNGGSAIANYGVAYYCQGGIPNPDPKLDKGRRDSDTANGLVDWDCDDLFLSTPVQADVDAAYSGIDAKGNLIPIFGVLSSSEDWNHLIYSGGAISGMGTGDVFLTNATTPMNESGVPLDNAAKYNLEVVSPGFAQVSPGTNLKLTYTIRNAGLQADIYNLAAVSQFNWWDTSGVPGTLTLASGASQQITIPVSVPASFGCSNLSAIQAQFSLRAVSQTHASLSDTGVAELDLAVSPGTAPVPAVTGLTQSEAQAAILAAGFVTGAVSTNSSSSVPAGTVISQTPFGCGFAAPGAAVSLVVSTGPALVVTPNVVGGTQVAAVAAMKAAGLLFGSEITVPSSSVPVGDVVSQNPPAGTAVTPGSFYSLAIASATPANALTPNLIGTSFSTATSAITAAGLNLGLITQAFSPTVPDGTVVAQVPAAGSPTSPGAYVNVTVSYDYSQLQNIPNIVGDTQAGAISAILSVGYSIGSIGEAASNTAPVGTVMLQSPLPGLLLSPTTPVSFSISTGPVGPQSFVVPNVGGLPQSAASSAITAAGLTVGTITASQELSVPVGNVFSQTPQAGAYAAGGSPVNLQVSAAPAQYTVPDLLTKPTFFSSAYVDIIAAGLTPGTFTAQISSAVPSGNVISQSPAAGAVVAGGSVVNVTYSLGIANNQLLNVVGENQVFATNSINSGASGFSVSITREPSTTVPDGYVISQNPVSNPLAPVPLYQVVNLVVSSGGPVAAAIPNVVGTTIISTLIRTTGSAIGAAEQTLNAAGFAVGSVTYQPSNSVPEGVVISQNPPAGTIAAWDTSVSFVYSSGPPASVTVPNIVGQTQAQAFAYLAAYSLRWTLTTQSSPTVPAGVVISQNPSAGTVLQGAIPGTGGTYAVPVTFVVSAGPKTVPTYSLLTQFGDYGGPYAGDGQFFTPVSLAIDPNTGNILAGDTTGRIQIFDRNGNFKRYFGGNGVEFFTSTVPGTNQLATIYPTGPGGGLFGDGFLVSPYASYIVGYPLDLAVDPINGNVVALDTADRVLIFNSAGVFQSTFGSTGQGAGQFSFFRGFGVVTSGVAIDPVTENILVADWGNNRVQIFSSTGVYLGQFGTQGAGNGQFGYGPMGIAIDPETRNIAVVDSGYISGNSRVEIFNSSGAYLSQFGPPVQAAGACWAPAPCGVLGLAIDPASHNIFVQGAIAGAGGAIQIFDSKGNYLSQFGGFGISQPGGLALDPVSHHIVTIGLAGDLDGTVQIFGAPLAPTPTSTALTSSLNPAASGQSVTFTATVNGTSPTGTVQFYYGATTLGAPVALATGMASFTTSSLPIGTDTIAAVYSGDGINATSISTVLNEVISSHQATVALASSLNPAIAGQAVTLTATVTGSSPTGTVEFLSGATSLGAPVALASGMAAFTTSTLPVGTDSITAVYSGDGSNATSTSVVLNETVSLASTSTALLSSSGRVTFGQPVTLTAVVTGDGPTGNVQFFDGATSLAAPVALTGNVATFTTSTLALGTHSITAAYKGDPSNSPSTSPALSEFISANAPTTTVLVASVNPIIVGQSVTFTATVTGTSPTGSIQFLDGAGSLGSPAALTSGTAAVTASGLTIGTHSITAVYPGDTTNAPSTSAILSEVVSLNATTTTVSSSTNPAIVGQFITYTATVTGKNPTGPVLFFDGATPLVTLKPATSGPGNLPVSGPLPTNSQSLVLSSGQVSITLAYPTAGMHSITAVYPGDGNNTASTSAALNQKVLAATTTALSASLNPSIFGQSVAFTATVTGSSPTGTIRFLDGATSLSSPIALTGGAATVATSALTVGTHSITAVYSGDASNTPSTSAILSEVISAGAAPPVVTPPAAISIPATQLGGATSGAWPALAAFLAGATATSTVSPAPIQLTPQIGGLTVTSTTLFPIGTTTVTFQFKDANGNIGSGTSTVTVAVGTPRITGSSAGVSVDPSGAISVKIVLTNTGTGNARNLRISTLVFRALSGTGTITYNTALSASLPLAIGNLDVGASVTTVIYLNVPSTVTRMSITESGPVQDVVGTSYNYSTAEAVIP
jgi:probable HAF family extracellular repeat protein